MNPLAVNSLSPFPFSRYSIFTILLYQLLLLVSFLFEIKWITLGLLGLLLPLFLFLPFTFWFYAFVSSIFVFWGVHNLYQISDVMALSMVAVFFGWYLISERMKLQASPLLPAILCFLLTIGISLLDPFDLRIGLIRFTRYIFLFITYWVIHNYLLMTKQVRPALRWYIFLTVIGCLTMFVQMILLGGIRSFGIGGIPFNDMLAAATIIVFCFLLFLDQSERGSRIVFFLFLIALLLTLTRVVWLGVTLTIMFLLIYLFKKERPQFGRLFRRELAPILISGFVLLIAATAIKPDLYRQVRNRFNQLSEFQYGDQVTSTLTRVLIWDTAINAFKKNPINGVGLDQFPHASREYYTIHPMLYELFVEGKDPHLLLLTFLTETGVIGAAGFLVLLFSSYILALKGYKMASTNEDKANGLSLLGIMFYIAVSSFYSGSWFYGQNSYQFMLFLAATSAFYQLKKDNYARN